MNRRSFLQQSALVAGISTAGCLDFTASAGTENSEAESATSTTRSNATASDEFSQQEVLAEGSMFQYTATNTGYHPSTTGPKKATRTLWEFTIGGELTSPVVYDGRLFTGSESGRLCAINIANGKAEWTYQSEDALTVPPAVAGDRVFAGGSDNKLYAVNTNTGTEEWTFEARSDITSAITVAANTLYVGSADQHLYAIDAETGDPRWRQKMDAHVTSVPAVSDGLVTVPVGNWLYVLSADTGERQWEKYLNTRAEGVTIYDGIAYVPTGDGGHDQHVLTFDITNGNERWRADVDGNAGAAVAATTGEMLYVADQRGNLYAFGLSTGRREWKASTGEWSSSSPVVVDGVVYLANHDGFYGYDATDGSEVFQTDVGAFTQTPTVLDGVAFIADTGKVTALTD